MNINIKEASSEDSEQAFFNELKSSLNKFRSIGLEFNDTLKNIDTSSKKIKENRQVKKKGRNIMKYQKRLMRRLRHFKFKLLVTKYYILQREN